MKHLKKTIDSMDIPEQDKKKLWKKILRYILYAGIGLAGAFQISQDATTFLEYLIKVIEISM